MTFLLTQTLENSPEIIDYIFVFWLLDEFDKHQYTTKNNIINELKKSQLENIQLTSTYTDKNLIDLGIRPIGDKIDSSKFISSKTDKYVDKYFKKLSTDVKSQILNMLNLGNSTELENYIESSINGLGYNNSTLARLMTLYRTECTLSRSNYKLHAQEYLLNEGINVKRSWLHTLSNPINTVTSKYRPREYHLEMNGVLEDNQGFFTTPLGNSGRAPGLFGVPEEDINCRCDVIFVLNE